MAIHQHNADELKRCLAEQLQKAEKAEAQKKGAEAGQHFRKMADLFRTLARMETNMMEVARLNKQAMRCDERAKAAGKNKPAAAPEIPAACQEDYTETIKGFIHRSEVTWEDIGGMEQAKKTMKYSMGLLQAKTPEDLASVELPTRFLFHGLPGAGKTLLAAASANQVGATLLNVKVSDLLSKYFGESTKLITALYVYARNLADSGLVVVFIDEIESLVPSRDSMDSGAERRIMSTFLSELDGLKEKKVASNVVTIAATNRPWDLDSAILSRMDMRVFADLPDEGAREAIFKIHLGDKGYKLERDCTYSRLAQATEGFAGRDIQRACKEVNLNVLASVNEPILERVELGTVRDYTVRTRPIGWGDFAPVLGRGGFRRGGADKELAKFREWAKTGGES